MEKFYRKPEVQVVKYQRPVKTKQEDFTNSKGQPSWRYRCPECNAVFFEIEVAATEYTDPKVLSDAFLEHLQQVHPGELSAPD